MPEFIFAEDADYFIVSNAHVAFPETNVKTKDGLLRHLSAELDFPAYYGLNWDALFDCLCDLSWIDDRRIIVVHSDVPAIPMPDLKKYLKVLREAIKCWGPEAPHSLEVVFPKQKEEYVKSLE